MSQMTNLILASSSKTRYSLLAHLKIPFQTIHPDIDESHLENEKPLNLVMRLSEAKALKVANQNQHNKSAWVIGSDEICVCEDKIFGKPKDFDDVKKQLLFFSGKKVSFYTGLCLTNFNSGQSFLDVIPYHIYFKNLDLLAINSYLDNEDENILECAGSIKAEGLAITLFLKMEGEDPTSLQGLPLIRLCDFLEYAKITKT